MLVTIYVLLCIFHVNHLKFIVCISTSFGIAIPWVDKVKYLGIFIVHSHTFRYDLDHVKKSFYRSAMQFVEKLAVQQMRKWWYSY